MVDVKRRYDGTARRARAEQVRTALLAAAQEVLLRDGYAALTVPRVAQACDVSVESVYKRFGGKTALVRAVVEQALRGDGPVAAESRSDSLDAGDLHALLLGWGRLSAEVAPRVAPILLVVQAAAAHDPELEDLARELDGHRRARMTDNARRLAAVGHLPAGMSTGRAADILWTYSAPQLYDLLVRGCGWSLQQFSAFVSDGIAAHLRAS